MLGNLHSVTVLTIDMFARKEERYNTTVEPQNNGQVGAGGFVRYSEVSFREVIP